MAALAAPPMAPYPALDTPRVHNTSQSQTPCGIASAHAPTRLRFADFLPGSGFANHNEQSAIKSTRDGSAPRSNPGISTAQTPGTQQDTRRDFASEWIQRAMQISTQMHANDALRREVAGRLF